jgi:hypothetical protein
MRKPSLTVDTFVAALAVLGVTASTGCSKAEHASVAPEPASAAAPAAPKSDNAPTPPAAQAAPAPLATAAAAAPAAEPAAAPQAADAKKPNAPARAAAGSAVSGRAVDGGVNRAADGDDKKKAGMSCGAGMCSADMKKGSGN